MDSCDKQPGQWTLVEQVVSRCAMLIFQHIQSTIFFSINCGGLPDLRVFEESAKDKRIYFADLHKMIDWDTQKILNSYIALSRKDFLTWTKIQG